jgi:hypothetical protein
MTQLITPKFVVLSYFLLIENLKRKVFSCLLRFTKKSNPIPMQTRNQQIQREKHVGPHKFKIFKFFDFLFVQNKTKYSKKLEKKITEKKLKNRVYRQKG